MKISEKAGKFIYRGYKRGHAKLYLKHVLTTKGKENLSVKDLGEWAVVSERISKAPESWTMVDRSNSNSNESMTFEQISQDGHESELRDELSDPGYCQV